MSEIAIFGGSFDPPTLAHEKIIEACLDREDLDEVWVMPSGKRMDKPGMTEDNIRLDMLSEVRSDSFGGNDKLVISDFEVNLPRPNRTIDTVSALEEVYPDSSFWFVFGADSYKDMYNWEGGKYLRSRLGMLLVARCGEVLPDETDRIRHLKIVQSLDMDISSTKIRQAIDRGEPINEYTSLAVAKYILGRSLYVSDS